MAGMGRMMSCVLLAVAGGAVRAAPPIGPATRVATIAAHQAACAGKEGWSDPAPPVRIFADVYDVGTCAITVLLIAGTEGAILIDGATAQAVPSIIGNIGRLGFRPADVKLLLSTHEHLDHAAGLYELRRRTGAKMVATAAARAPLQSGVPARGDPQRDGDAAQFRGVRVDRIVRDGEVVRLGSLRLAAHATPGHAPGGTSWSWRSCAGQTCHDIVYADSVSAVSTSRYRFVDHPGYVAAFRASMGKLARLPCDLLVTPHPAASNLYARMAGEAPLSAATACADYAAGGLATLDRRLAAERTAARSRRGGPD
jgi:metallo-beta-lactamase class B